MKNEKKLDVRVRYTRQIIQDAFLTLLKEKPLHSITVREICDRAGINRTTFYKHYRDTYDLMEQVENASIESMASLMDQYPEENTQKVLLIVLKELYNHQDDLLSLLQNNNSDFFYRMADRCFEKLKVNAQTKGYTADTFLSSPMHFGYFAGGIGGVMAYWIRNGMQESPEEIAASIHKLSLSLWTGYHSS